MSAAPKYKMGSEDKTKDFVIPAELLPDKSKIIQLKEIKENASPVSPSEVTQTKTEFRPKADFSKMVQILARETKKIGPLEKKLSEELEKLSELEKKLSRVNLASQKKLQQEMHKRIQEFKLQQKNQFEELQAELIKLKQKVEMNTVSPVEAKETKIQELTTETHPTMQILASDYQKVSGEIQELHKTKLELESYIGGLRSEFDEKEKGLKALESQKKSLQETVLELEEEIRNYRDYLQK